MRRQPLGERVVVLPAREHVGGVDEAVVVGVGRRPVAPPVAAVGQAVVPGVAADALVRGLQRVGGEVVAVEAVAGVVAGGVQGDRDADGVGGERVLAEDVAARVGPAQAAALVVTADRVAGEQVAVRVPAGDRDAVAGVVADLAATAGAAARGVEDEAVRVARERRVLDQPAAAPADLHGGVDVVVHVRAAHGEAARAGVGVDRPAALRAEVVVDRRSPRSACRASRCRRCRRRRRGCRAWSRCAPWSRSRRRACRRPRRRSPRRRRSWRRWRRDADAVAGGMRVRAAVGDREIAHRDARAGDREHGAGAGAVDDGGAGAGARQGQRLGDGHVLVVGAGGDGDRVAGRGRVDGRLDGRVVVGDGERRADRSANGWLSCPVVNT